MNISKLSNAVLISTVFYLPSVAWAGEPQPAIPRGNPGNWIVSSDYPFRSLAARNEGVTGFRLTISASGTVTDCEVISSSGFAELDLTTCSKIKERARFKPAVDSDGQKVAGEYFNRVRWQIPDTKQPIPVDGQFSISFTIEMDGSTSNCRVSGDIPDAEMSNTCNFLGDFERPLDANGKPVRKRVTQAFAVRVKDIVEK